MKKVIQKRVVQVIQKEIAEYYCDSCLSRCGVKGNPKQTWHSAIAGTRHYCARGCHSSERRK